MQNAKRQDTNIKQLNGEILYETFELGHQCIRTIRKRELLGIEKWVAGYQTERVFQSEKEKIT